MSMPLLSGHVTNDDNIVSSLRMRLGQALEDLEVTRVELDAERRKTRGLELGVTELRRQLSPLYQALRMVFGEMDAIPVGEGVPSSVPNVKRKVWDDWIDKFGRETLNAKLIAALLDHGTMSPAQLRVAMKCGENSVYEAIKRLKKLGLLQGTAGKYSLKEL